MLIPLTRAKFEQIIPLIATGPQYAYYWGDLQNVLKQLLFSAVAVLIVWLLGSLLGEAGQGLTLILGITAGLYWLWNPVYWASLKNGAYRRYPYSGFWRGQVLDVYITEELVRTQENVNEQGQLEIIETREPQINIDLGDEAGFLATVRAKLRRIHKVIKPGETAELLILSNQSDLSKINKITDVYIPRHNLYVGEYPYLSRDIFNEVSQRLTPIENNRPNYSQPTLNYQKRFRKP